MPSTRSTRTPGAASATCSAVASPSSHPATTLPSSPSPPTWVSIPTAARPSATPASATSSGDHDRPSGDDHRCPAPSSLTAASRKPSAVPVTRALTTGPTLSSGKPGDQPASRPSQLATRPSTTPVTSDASPERPTVTDAGTAPDPLDPLEPPASGVGSGTDPSSERQARMPVLAVAGWSRVTATAVHPPSPDATATGITMPSGVDRGASVASWPPESVQTARSGRSRLARVNHTAPSSAGAAATWS